MFVLACTKSNVQHHYIACISSPAFSAVYPMTHSKPLFGSLSRFSDLRAAPQSLYTCYPALFAPRRDVFPIPGSRYAIATENFCRSQSLSFLSPARTTGSPYSNGQNGFILGTPTIRHAIVQSRTSPRCIHAYFVGRCDIICIVQSPCVYIIVITESQY